MGFHLSAIQCALFLIIFCMSVQGRHSHIDLIPQFYKNSDYGNGIRDGLVKESAELQRKFVQKPSFCFLEHDGGMCLAYITKFYYDYVTRTCKRFVYGGCGGNENRFSTMSECVTTCKMS